MAAFDAAVKTIKSTTARAGAVGISFTSKGLLQAWGIPIASVALAAFSEFEHFLTKEDIKNEYLPEIASKSGKSKDFIEIKDMEEAAKKNPIISESLQRSTTKRNLNIAKNIGCTVLAFAAATTLAPLFATMGAAIVAGGAISFATFFISEKIVNSVGKAMLNLNEPSIKDVENNPALQLELSAPSQIRYLEKLQDKRQNISENQVISAFLKANPALKQEFSSNKNDAMEKYHITELTELLNTGQVRAQEIAFAAFGDKSGVDVLESPRETMLQRYNQELQQKLQHAQEQLGHVTNNIGNKAGELAHSAREKTSSMIDHVKNRFDPKVIIADREGKSAISPESIIKDREQQKSLGLAS